LLAETAKVLVVEDEPFLLMLAMDVVEAAGYHAIGARNADEAIRVLEVHQDIRIVFTDIDMPGSMDGLKLARAVRGRWPPVSVIVTSGHMTVSESDLPDRTRFFPKPYKSNEITAALRSMAA
jgi:DNA-binding NtrC family response regulator